MKKKVILLYPSLREKNFRDSVNVINIGCSLKPITRNASIQDNSKGYHDIRLKINKKKENHNKFKTRYRLRSLMLTKTSNKDTL